MAVVAVRFSVISFQLRSDVLNQFARRHDGRQSVRDGHHPPVPDFFLRFAGSKKHGHRKASLHQDADGGHGNKDDQQSLGRLIHLLLNSLVRRRSRCRIGILARIHRCGNLACMLGNDLAATIDVILYLGTSRSHRLLTTLNIVT